MSAQFWPSSFVPNEDFGFVCTELTLTSLTPLLVGSFGADSARPPSYFIAILLTCFSILGPSRYLVRRSAGFSGPGTLFSVKSPVLTLSWTHRSATARCRILPSPLLRQIPIAAVARSVCRSPIACRDLVLRNAVPWLVRLL